MKVLSVFGTRPEAIKMAPVVKALAQAPEGIISRVCVTAQHREMLDQVLNLFRITPDYDLNLMQARQSPTRVAAHILLNLEQILADEQPDWVLVQGDTTTVMAAALAAFYARVKVGHVEAGLRTRNKWQPFPEEINRRVAGVTADLHFAPTPQARQNLLAEQIPAEQIVVTGNTVIDALQWVAGQPPTRQVDDLRRQIGLTGGYGAARPRLILVTAHRRENFGQPLQAICAALAELASRYGDALRIVYPVHLNPNVSEPVHRLLGNVPNIVLLPPLDYLPLVHLLKEATLVLTDSGGLQEEAPGLGKPVLVLRDVTERPEGVAAGTVKLVGTGCAAIVAETCRLLDNPADYERMARAANPYGDGQAARRIVETLLNNS